MPTEESIKTPYHITFVGALISIVESASDFFLYDYYMENNPFQAVSETAWMVSAAIGLLAALFIAGYLYYHRRNNELTKDVFMVVIIASLVGLLIGGQLANIVTLIGALVCYRRF